MNAVATDIIESHYMFWLGQVEAARSRGDLSAMWYAETVATSLAFARDLSDREAVLLCDAIDRAARRPHHRYGFGEAEAAWWINRALEDSGVDAYRQLDDGGNEFWVGLPD